MQLQLLKVDHMRQHIIVFQKGSLGGQRIVEVRKDKKYSRAALGLMKVKLLPSVMTATRNCSIIQFSCLKTSSGLQTPSGAEDSQKTERQSRERRLLEELNCFMKLSAEDLKK
jgi:hypothetical protein